MHARCFKTGDEQGQDRTILLTSSSVDCSPSHEMMDDWLAAVVIMDGSTDARITWRQSAMCLYATCTVMPMMPTCYKTHNWDHKCGTLAHSRKCTMQAYAAAR